MLRPLLRNLRYLVIALTLSAAFAAFADPPPWVGKNDPDDPPRSAPDVGPPATPEPPAKGHGHGRHRVEKREVEPPKVATRPQVPVTAAPSEADKRKRLKP